MDAAKRAVRGERVAAPAVDWAESTTSDLSAVPVPVPEPEVCVEVRMPMPCESESESASESSALALLLAVLREVRVTVQVKLASKRDAPSSRDSSSGSCISSERRSGLCTQMLATFIGVCVRIWFGQEL